jgi:hypothetical protein
MAIAKPSRIAIAGFGIGCKHATTAAGVNP